MTAAALPRHTYAPAFEVTVGGAPLPPGMRAAVTALRHQDGIEGADRVELTIADDRGRWLDHPQLALDAPFELRMGYAPHVLDQVFTGEVTGVDAAFPASGSPTVTVVAHDFLHRLTKGAKDRAFALSLPCIGKFPLPDPVIVAAVAATDLLVPVVDPAGAALSFLTLLATYLIDPADASRSIRVQKGQSDFDFLAGLARQNGWDMYIEHGAPPSGRVLRFLFPGPELPPAVQLDRGTTLVDFTPRVSEVGQVVAVAARIWVSALKAEFVVVLGWDHDRAAFDLQVFPGLGDLDALLGEEKARGTLTVTADGPATAPRRVLGELLPRLNNRLTASGSAAGDPRIKAGRVIAVSGVGLRFSGLYRVVSATHTLDSGGYRTSFDLRREVWFPPLPVPRGIRLQGRRLL
ncbi:phage late control D family protein [Streptomyces sp. BYX5S]